MLTRANLQPCLAMAVFLVAMGCGIAAGDVIYVDDDAELGIVYSDHDALGDPCETILQYTGEVAGQYSDTVDLSATLVSGTSGGGLGGKLITFTIGSQSTTAVTDPDGTASTTMTLEQVPGGYTVWAVFAGDEYYQGSSDADPFTIDREDTALEYTGELYGQYSDTLTLAAVLSEADPEVGNVGGKSITFTIGSQSTTAVTGPDGTASTTMTLNQVPGSYIIHSVFAGDEYYEGSSASEIFTVITKENTVLGYTGDVAGQYSDTTTVSAVLLEIDAELGNLGGKLITFTIGNQSTTAVTNPDGTASTIMTLNQVSGNYTVWAVFAGDEYYRGSADADPFTIDREDTALEYTGELYGQYSDTITLAAVLSETDFEVGDLDGKSITFTIGSQSATAYTDNVGVASTTMTLNQAPGSYIVHSVFAGDECYERITQSETFEILPLDSDDDGIPDEVDNCPDANNPAQIDTDSDGVGNVCDNCPDALNPEQTDCDADGVGDLCDLLADLSNDGKVDFGDFAILAIQWMEDNCNEPAWCSCGDFDRSSIVDANDLAYFTHNWLELARVKFYKDGLEFDIGWSVQGEWEFGQPTGGGGAHGNPDPNTGYYGSKVYGVNLNGDYLTYVSGPYYLTAGPFDCGGYRNVHLKFARWLNSDTPVYVSSKIEVSNNEADWEVVWQHIGASDITDSDWQFLEYNISSTADNEPAVYIRWSYEILDDHAFPYSGWNVDYVQLWGNP